MSTSAAVPSDLPAGSGPLPEIPGIAVQHEFLDLPGGRFHVARAGDRSLPAIMLVHGFPQNWWEWRDVVKALDGQAHIVMPDLRGAGWSNVPTERSAYKKAKLAEDLNDVLEALGIEQIAVGAHDWGAWLTQMLAVAHPERVSRMLLLSIPSVIPTPRPPAREMLRMVYQLQFSSPGSAWFFTRFPEKFAHGMRADVQKRDAFTFDDAMAFAGPYSDPVRARAAQSTYRTFLFGGDAVRITSGMRGKKFAMPARFILSAHDGYIPPSYIKGIERTGAQVDGFIQDRTGHFIADEDPEYVAEQIREFLLPAAVPLG
jgi:pimeloyl-ACP methyl ester carboxylesterase